MVLEVCVYGTTIIILPSCISVCKWYAFLLLEVTTLERWRQGLGWAVDQMLQSRSGCTGLAGGRGWGSSSIPDWALSLSMLRSPSGYGGSPWWTRSRFLPSAWVVRGVGNSSAMASAVTVTDMPISPTVEVIKTSYHTVKEEVFCRPKLVLEYDFFKAWYIYVYVAWYLLACIFLSVLRPFGEGVTLSVCHPCYGFGGIKQHYSTKFNPWSTLYCSNTPAAFSQTQTMIGHRPWSTSVRQVKREHVCCLLWDMRGQTRRH